MSVHQATEQFQTSGFELITGKELLEKEFQPIEYVVQDILAPGLTILAGRPKRGKSWLALDWAICVASGSTWNDKAVKQGDVLYLALEDNERRLKERLKKLNFVPNDANKLSFGISSPPIGSEFKASVEKWASDAEAPRLLIVDTYSKVKPSAGANTDDYLSEYAALTPLLELARDLELFILLIHHQKKGVSDDPFEGVLGSTALTGAPDTIILLTVHQKKSALLGKGRDIPEFEYAVDFQKDQCRWTVRGSLKEASLGDTKQKILDAIADGHTRPQVISEAAGLDGSLVRQTLGRMVDNNELVKIDRGKYALPD